MHHSARIRIAASLALATIAALVATVLGLGVASAATTGTTASSPDASHMVLRASDFAPGTTVSGGPSTRGPGFVTGYANNLVTPTTPGGATFLAIYSEVDVAGDLSTAQAGYAAESGTLRSRSGRNGLARSLRQGGLQVPRRALHFGRVRRLAIGDEAVLLPLSFKYRGVAFNFQFVVERVDRGVATLVFGALGSRPQTAAVMALARTQAEHIRAGLTSGA